MPALPVSDHPTLLMQARVQPSWQQPTLLRLSRLLPQRPVQVGAPSALVQRLIPPFSSRSRPSLTLSQSSGVAPRVFRHCWLLLRLESLPHSFLPEPEHFAFAPRLLFLQQSFGTHLPLRSSRAIRHYAPG